MEYSIISLVPGLNMSQPLSPEKQNTSQAAVQHATLASGAKPRRTGDSNLSWKITAI